MKSTFTSVDEYILSFPKDVQEYLLQIRDTIRNASPEAEESISYAMPAYKLNGKPLVYFAGYKNHIGLYATPSGHVAFSKELASYKQGKGSVQFPLNQDMPLDLIARIVRYKTAEYTADAAAPTRRARTAKK